MQPDKIKHGIVGTIMGFLASYLGYVALIIGWIVIIGYELFQGWTGSGVCEFGDILAGGIPFTLIFFFFYGRSVRRRAQRNRK